MLVPICEISPIFQWWTPPPPTIPLIIHPIREPIASNYKHKLKAKTSLHFFFLLRYILYPQTLNPSYNKAKMVFHKSSDKKGLIKAHGSGCSVRLVYASRTSGSLFILALFEYFVGTFTKSKGIKGGLAKPLGLVAVWGSLYVCRPDLETITLSSRWTRVQPHAPRVDLPPT